MWELDHKEGWVLKNWCFLTVMLGQTLESPLDCKEIKPVNPKGNQPWIFTGRTDTEALILWPPDVKNRLTWKDPDSGKDLRQEEKRMTEDEMVGWHHQLNGHGFRWTPGGGDGQGGLACCSYGVAKNQTRLTTELNWNFGDLNGKEIQKTRDMCISIAESLHCTLKTQHGKTTIL